VSKVALVVDDSMTIRRLVGMTLKKIGYEVVEAENGRDGLTKAKATAFSLIITDLNMPIMDGLELIRALRSEPQHKFTPVVFLTTEIEESKREDARAAGATAWIQKPFHAEKVLAVVQRIAV
jgi:two-component system, chemotaxis family, chemotaxis protein CheY